MADKKEVFDYLRNQQKAAEIEAKVNGINLWVLIGAIAVVTWQLLGNLDEKLWSEPEVVLRTLLFTEAVYMLSFWGASTLHTREELRYSQWKLSEMESPFLVLLQGILLLLPPAFSLYFIEKTGGAFILGFLGLAIVITSVASICSHFRSLDAINEKFPKPEFEPTARSNLIVSLIFGILFAYAIIEQIIFAWNHRGAGALNFTKQMSLLVVLYLLIMLTIKRKLRSNGIAWTYQLETELLLGTVNADVALRRIENRALGPRLQDVMNRFFDDMDSKFKNMESAFDQCRSKLESVKDVPLEYSAERAARAKDATQVLSNQIEEILADCSDFSNYLRKLEEKSTVIRKAALAPHLLNLKNRQEHYAKRVRKSKSELERLLNGAVTSKPGSATQKELVVIQ